VRSATGPGNAALSAASVRHDGDTLAIDLGSEIVLAEGQSLGLKLGAG
jgi:hypothetical protein